MNNGPDRITLAMTGASGAQYGLRLLDCLVREDREVHFLISKAAQLVLATETDVTLPPKPQMMQAFLTEYTGAVAGQDLEIPERPFTFGQLIAAQAAGDAQVLADHDRPVLRLHLTDRAAGLAQVSAALGAGGAA